MSNPRAKDQTVHNDRLRAEAVIEILNITWEQFVKIHSEITKMCALKDEMFRALCADKIHTIATQPSESQAEVDAAVDALCARSMETSQSMVNDGRLETNGTYTAEGVNFWAMQNGEARKRDQSSKRNSGHAKRAYTGESPYSAAPAPKRTRLETSISNQWPVKILEKFGWNNAETISRDKLTYVHKCTVIYPNFQNDFVPQANLVRWLKHCSAVFALEKAREPDDFAPYGTEFAVKDLKHLQELKKSKSVRIYDTEVTLDTANEMQAKIKEWTENQDGIVTVRGNRVDLKKPRPYHWNTLLLKFDEDGLLVRRDIADRITIPCRNDGIPPPVTSMLASVENRARLQSMSTTSPILASTNGLTSDDRGSVVGSASGTDADDVAKGVTINAVHTQKNNTVDSEAEAARMTMYQSRNNRGSQSH
jgi:hypothetical protein